ncbi:uncharacterized protein LOC127788951 [Diospyros lotus]|uniref:uncharacterized protein LOC127788951 n=1 Tax=Diospyros lotus TaxID=55363 RepID=UPI00224DEB16|nr:uncharacterized protein LOC127788951 [Diospyros lotus]
MGTGRQRKNFIPSGSATPASIPATSHVNNRNLMKNHLGGVIFGCNNTTIKECLSKQLFGLPAEHFMYVKNIDAGLALFLLNYSNRKLYGIFEAASSGQMNIDPYAWTTDGSDRTKYPAQVQIRVQLQCQPLPEEQFKPVISDNYYNGSHFWFELDHAQASKLMSLLSSRPTAASTVAPQNTRWRYPFLNVPSNDSRDEIEDEQLMKKEEDLIYMKLRELTHNRKYSDLSSMRAEDATPVNDVRTWHNDVTEAQISFAKGNEKRNFDSFDYPSVITLLIQGMEELKAFKIDQNQKLSCLENKLVEAEQEIESLKCRCKTLESKSLPLTTKVDEMNMESQNDCEQDIGELIFLVGGYDGKSLLSALDSYSPMHDVIMPLQSMNIARSYASVAILKDELYIFGGGDGSLWIDTVESYDLPNNQWTMRPPLNVKKGCLAGATLNDKIFAIGGGNGTESFADVEMFDIDVGHWISTRSMLQKRYALAAAELNGALYAVGGYNGTNYLKSAERFDPREHSWHNIGSMNTPRGCHSLAILNEKIYAIGGYDGTAMIPSTEIFDPRVGSWMTGEPINQSRGYFAAPVLKGSIYLIGGVESGETIIETVERYVDGQGWQATNLGAIGKRCFLSAISYLNG